MERSTLASLAVAATLLPAAPAQEDATLTALDRAIARTRTAVQKTTDLYEDHSNWANPWIAQSKHFEVRTVKTYAEASNIAYGLDRMLGYFQQALGLDYVPPERIRVFVYPDDLQYNAIGDTHAEHSSFYGSFYANAATERHVATAPHPNPTSLRMQITHSALHHYLDLAFPGTTKPLWVEEGLAAYFALYWDYNWGVDELARINKGRTWVPLRQLIRDPIAQYGTRTHERMIELGMLFYYMFRFREDTRTTQPDEEAQRAPFRDYIVTLLRGQNARRFSAHDLLMQPEQLEQEFRAYEFPR